MVFQVDFLIVGGGIIGLSIARELHRRDPAAKICLIEKEVELGKHASGRNSGVLHAGFYYTADSLKARFTREGNRALTVFCEEHNLKINKCGKLVVARGEQDLASLDELIKRGRNNGVELQEISTTEARALEPRVKTYQRALFSPTTSSVNPKEVVRTLAAEIIKEGVSIHSSVEYIRYDGKDIHTNKGNYRAGYIVNAAGLYADRVARDFGFSKYYRILPFKGLYLYSNELVGGLKRHVYPVPDLRNPFLGVHFTVTVDGHIKIGPTALPALWREQYKGFSGFNFSDILEIGTLQTSLLAKSNFEFRRLAVEEISKKSRRQMVKLASELVEGVELNNYRQWGEPGIRAQLFDLRTSKLEMDFVIEGDSSSMHILNAVSPGLTCALPLAKYVCEKIESNKTSAKTLYHPKNSASIYESAAEIYC